MGNISQDNLVKFEETRLTKQAQKMAGTMLEYTKTVLQKVSFDARLFSRELQKAIKRLLPNELEELRNWLLLFTTDKPELQQTLQYLPV